MFVCWFCDVRADHDIYNVFVKNPGFLESMPFNCFFCVIVNCLSIEGAISFHKVQLCILQKLEALLINYICSL